MKHFIFHFESHSMTLLIDPFFCKLLLARRAPMVTKESNSTHYICICIYIYIYIFIYHKHVNIYASVCVRVCLGL